MGVKCLVQEHDAVPRPGLEPGPFDPESSALTIRPLHLPRLGGGMQCNALNIKTPPKQVWLYFLKMHN